MHDLSASHDFQNLTPLSLSEVGVPATSELFSATSELGPGDLKSNNRSINHHSRATKPGNEPQQRFYFSYFSFAMFLHRDMLRQGGEM
jgi:hypothetical protein